jgi:hypothetical protein
MSMVLRVTIGPNALNYACTYPLSCYIRAILYTYPGGIMSSALVGVPLFSFMTNPWSFLPMTIAWYLVFFGPKDFLARSIHSLHLQLPFTIAQDFLRLHLCYMGVAFIKKDHPTGFIYMVFFAIIKSSGFMFLKYIEQALDHGLSKPFVVPNHPSKTCVLASVAFAAQATGLIDLGGEKIILTGFTLLVINLRVFSLFSSRDPYDWFEVFTCILLFGKATPELLEEKARKKVLYTMTKHVFKVTC